MNIFNKSPNPADICGHCGSKKGMAQKNYAGFFDKAELIEFYPFPYRIQPPAIPGPVEIVFICDKCASAHYKIHCRAHGTLKDSYGYGKPPKCLKCEADLKHIRNGVRPNSFEAIVPHFKEQNDSQKVWFAFSKFDEVSFVEDKSLLSGKIEDFSYLVKSDGNYLYLVAESKKSNLSKTLALYSTEQLIKGIGPWVKPWIEEIKKILVISDNNPIYFSFFEYHTVQKNNLVPKVDKSNLTFWRIDGNRIITVGMNFVIPSLDFLISWSFSSSINQCELTLHFNVDNVPSLLIIAQPIKINGIESIANNNLPVSMNLPSDKIKFVPEIGLFKFNLNQLDNQDVLIEKRPSNVLLTVLSTGQKIEYNYGYMLKSHILLIDSINKQYAVSCSRSNEFNKLCSSLIEPDSIFNKNIPSFAVCFWKDSIDNKIIYLTFFDLGFEVDENRKIPYKDIIDFEHQKHDGKGQLGIKYNVTTGNIEKLIIVGPEKYIHDIWQYVEMKRVENVTKVLTTNDLYKKYNELKKQNLLTGLLSDVILLNKELEREISVENLMRKLELSENRSFYEDKILYNQTINKLVIFSQLLPKIKQNYEVMNSFYPHYQLKNELDFVAEAFGSEVAEEIESKERDNVIGVSRNNIGAIQYKFQRVFSEIERSLSTVENIFTRAEIQKDFAAKAAKYAAIGGQAVLVGTLVITGAATSGIGVLAGMLGIRAMSEILGSIRMDLETAIHVKIAAERSFSWWSVFKTTLPVTIFETSKMIEKENDRCVKRDHNLFQHVKRDNAISVDRLNKTIERKIAESTSVRFEEILVGSGILFKEIADDINKAINTEMPTDIKYNKHMKITQ
jgi:hypothetical protein